MQISNSRLSRVVNTTKSILRTLAGYDYPTICDISYAQADKNIDWNRVRELGIGILIRGGQYNYEDSLFRTHYNNAVTHGVPFGMYWFVQPDKPPTLQLNKLFEVYDSLAVKPKVIAIDVEPIVYTGVSIYPPTPEIHSYWLMVFLAEIEKHTGLVPVIYTRQNYWDEWVRRSGTRILYNGMPYILPDWSHYPLWIASWTVYTQNIRIPLDWTVWKIWQYEGGTGRQDGIIGPVDKNYFNGTQEEMVEFFGGETMTASIPNTAVSQLNRARIIEITSKLASADMTKVSTEVDAVLVKMGGMDGVDGSGKELYTESGWDIRVDQARALSLPVLGQFGLRAGYHLFKQRRFGRCTNPITRE